MAYLLKTLFKSLLHFLYPSTCAACGKEMEMCGQLICQSCVAQLPYIDGEKHIENAVFLNLAGRLPLQFASATFEFRKHGIVQHLLHQLKYEGRQDIGFFLGQISGERLKKSTCFEFPNYIIPVPLHKKKLKKRGYNQSLCIARGIALSFTGSIIHEHILLKPEATESQTKKNRLARWENVKDTFTLADGAKDNPEFQGKHFLLVDDVLTTGATMESCARKLLQIPGIRLSVVTMASPL